MARIPQRNELPDIQLAIKDVNDENRELQQNIDKVAASIPSTKDVETLKTQVADLKKKPNYPDPNDVFRGSGPSHMHGYVPDPGATPGTSKYLREDGNWREPAGGGGTTNHSLLTNRSDPNSHPATAISNIPFGHIAATDVQEALDELDNEKLARDGSQTMLGTLDMNHHDVNNVNNLEVEASETVAVDLWVAHDVTIGNNLGFTGPVGAAQETNVRKIIMAGLEGDAEARISNVRGVVFLPGTASPAEGRVAWDITEGVPVAYALSGGGVA